MYDDPLQERPYNPAYKSGKDVFYGAENKMVISEAIKKFAAWRTFKVQAVTVKGYELYLRQFALFVHNREIEKIELEDITSWFTLMKVMDWQHNSFMPKAVALKKFFEFFKKQGYNVIDPWLIPVPKKEYAIPRVATQEQYEKLVAAIPRDGKVGMNVRNLAIIGMLYDTGARNGEICSLDIKDINLKEMKAVIRTEKSQGRKPFRQIYWTERTNEWLIAWMQRREKLKDVVNIKDDKALFISLRNAKSGCRIENKGIGDMLRKLSEKAGIPTVNPHSFRHKLGHDMVKSGMNNSSISAVLGHSSLESSYTYTQLSNLETEQQYKKIRR